MFKFIQDFILCLIVMACAAGVMLFLVWLLKLAFQYMGS